MRNQQRRPLNDQRLQLAPQQCEVDCGGDSLRLTDNRPEVGTKITPAGKTPTAVPER